MDPVFSPPGEAWQRVSPKLAVLRRRLLLLWTFGLVAAVAGIGWWLVDWWVAAMAVGLGAVAIGWGLWLIDRNWRAWGYAEREDDLLVTHGVLFRKLTVVPYGRMQFVDVQSGPLERRLGLATVQLHTASPASDARIPGLPPDEAARLRDRLAALGEAQAAGL
ncbi:MAG: PH domain-containing protein [Thermoleophilaceae bacterium]